jgi:hypothetical protein
VNGPLGDVMSGKPCAVVSGPARQSGAMEQTNPMQDLRQMADEIRLQLHLGGMEAKDAWARFEPRLRAFEQTFERATEGAAADLEELADVLRKEMQKIKARLDKA